MPATSLVQALAQYDPGFFNRLHAWITAERVYRYLQPIADTPAPSQSAVLTRAPVVERLLAEDGLLARPHVRFERNFHKTGNSALLLGRSETQKQVWWLAHLDVISYLIEPPVGGRYPLMPLCYHMMQPGRRPAQALAYDLEQRCYTVVAAGDLVVEAQGAIFFEPQAGAAVRAGHRVVFHSELTWNRTTGEVRGSLDDAACVAALLAAAGTLTEYPVEILVGLTDEEEGTGGPGNQTICRGGDRLLRFFDQPDLVIVSDVHEAAPMVEGRGPDSFEPGEGASFAEKSSRGKGAVTPPPLYELQRQLARELAGEGIRLQENIGGYVSRSEDVNAVQRTPNIGLLGVLAGNRHFDNEITSGNLDDLVNLAKSIACYTLLTQTPAWASLGLGA